MGRAKILIVDDDIDLVAAIQAILEAEEYEVITANDPVGGLEKVKNEKPDLLILDVMMITWQDGFDVSRELKRDPLFQDMPILMLTGIKEQTGLNFKLSAGDPTWMPVDGFLDKPFESQSLLAEIEKLLSNRK